MTIHVETYPAWVILELTKNIKSIKHGYWFTLVIGLNGRATPYYSRSAVPRGTPESHRIIVEAAEDIEGGESKIQVYICNDKMAVWSARNHPHVKPAVLPKPTIDELATQAFYAQPSYRSTDKISFINGYKVALRS